MRTASKSNDSGSRSRFLLACALFLYLIISLFYVVFAQLQIDESCYLSAGLHVYRGDRLYHDFLYIQTPVLPYVYGLPQILTGGNIYAGRLTSVFFGLLNFLIAVRLAGKLWGASAKIITAFLFALNPFLIFFFSTVKVYALPSFLLLLGLTFWFSDMGRGLKAFLILICMTLAMGTRFSLLIFPCMALFYIFFMQKKSTWAERFLALAGFALVFAVVFLPFLLVDPGRMLYDFIGFHMDIKLASTFQAVLHKLGSTRRMVTYLFFFFMCLFAAFMARTWRIREFFRLFLRGDSIIPYLWLALVLVFLGHYRAGFVQESYNLVLFPLAALLISGPLARFYDERPDPVSKRILFIIFLAGGILTLFMFGRTSVYYVDGKTSIQYAQSLADLVAAHSDPDDLIISSDTTLLALLAKRDVKREFLNCEYYGLWPTERCIRHRVVNDELLLKMIREGVAKIYIYNELSYTNEFPTYRPLDPAKQAAILDTLDNYYDLLLEHPNVYDPTRKSWIYVRKDRVQ